MKVTKKDILFYSKIIKWPIILIICFCVQWFFMHQYINKVKTEYLKSIKENNKIEPFYFDFTKSNNKQIVLNPEEFKKMYEHINSLSEKVSEESKRTQEFIDKDIDRLNLYMAVGIGFIAVLGVIVPVLVNVLSFDDLRNKQVELDNKQIELNNKQVNLDTDFDNLTDEVKRIPTDKIHEAIKRSDDIESLISRTTDVEAMIQASIPKISMLSLQYSIIRYFYMSPTLMSNLIRENDADTLVNLITSIKDGFVECKNNSSLDDCNLRKTFEDFILFIQDTRFHSTFLNRKITQSFFELGKELKNLIAKNGDINTIYSNIDDKFTEIIDLIKEYNAKTEPAIT